MKDITRESLRKFDGRVFLVNAGFDYPANKCFHPSEQYPEYPFSNHLSLEGNSNEIYKAVRQLFMDMGLDKQNAGTTKWNPLREFVHNGDLVVIKPNWVSHFVQDKVENPANILEVLVTHTSLLRAVVDYVYLAVGVTGKIILADSPIQGTNFELLLERVAIRPLLAFYREFSVPIEIIDLRKVYTRIDKTGRIIEHIPQDGDPRGYTIVRVDRRSMLTDLDDDSVKRYRVYDYDARQMQKTHGAGKHRYLISNTVLNADLIINLPKLKTHIKTGMTGAMKNFVGVNGDKSFLPHYRAGSPAENGDDYPKRNFWRLLKTEYRYTVAHWPNWLRYLLRAVGNRLIESSEGDRSKNNVQNDPYVSSGGSWHGNDTAWRMVVDLVMALLYSNPDGEIEDSIQRRWLTIIDAVVAGEGSGPLSPSPHTLGYLIAGVNPVELDFVCAHLMGFDWKKLKFIPHGYTRLFNKHDFDDLKVILNGKIIDSHTDIPQYTFRPPPGWEDYLGSKD